jgi:DNA-binding transcriptional LysR family regulator
MLKPHQSSGGKVMNAHQLECFLEVANSLSFARAAELLNVSQSAVSRQISSLEADLGVKLFHRTTRNVALTPYGRAFLPDAKDIHNRMLAAYSKVQHDAETYVPILSIGCSNNLDLDFFTFILEHCRDKLPELHPYVRTMPHKRMINMLLQDDLDLAFGFQEELQNSVDLKYLHLFYVDICCAVSTAHPLAQRDTVALKELYQEKAIFCSVADLPTSVTSLQKQLEYRYLSSNLYYCDDIPVTLAFIRAGFGYSILPDLQSECNPGITCIPLEGVHPLSYGIYYRQGHEKDPLFKSFVSLLYNPSNHSEG